MQKASHCQLESLIFHLASFIDYYNYVPKFSNPILIMKHNSTTHAGV